MGNSSSRNQSERKPWDSDDPPVYRKHVVYSRRPGDPTSGPASSPSTARPPSPPPPSYDSLEHHDISNPAASSDPHAVSSAVSVADLGPSTTRSGPTSSNIALKQQAKTGRRVADAQTRMARHVSEAAQRVAHAQTRKARRVSEAAQRARRIELQAELDALEPKMNGIGRGVHW